MSLPEGPTQRDDASYMGLALEEARKGEGRTSPNPAVGAIVGTVGAVMALTIGGSPLPGFGYLIAVGVLACATAVAGAVVPAVAASRRDPLTELRVP